MYIHVHMSVNLCTCSVSVYSEGTVEKKKGTETWLAQNFHIESEHISWLAFDKLESFEERKTQLKIYL